MFDKLGHFVALRWQYIIAGWLIVLVGLFAVAPAWDDVVQDGEFAFLPEDSESRLAEAAYAEAFPQDVLASQIFVVVRRTSNAAGLSDKDREFVDQVLVPRIMDTVGLDPDRDDEEEKDEDQVVTRIRWFKSRGVGSQLESADNKATLVQVELRNEFLNKKNHGTVAAVEDLLLTMRYEKQVVSGDDGAAREVPVVPGGLDLSVSGNATFGRDMMKAAHDSARATERWTVLLVIVLLLLIYRAPLLALIPLMTVAVATEITKRALSILAGWGWVDLFAGIETYVTVVVYGAGVDYCLFLIARYKEELDESGTLNDAVVRSLGKVGAALTASAGTVMCGIGMMVFAEFGKFQQAGVAITCGLAIVLTAALTFTPAVLRFTGRWAFWPNQPTEKIEGDAGWIPPSTLMTSIRETNLLQVGWKRVSQLLLAKPGTIWLISAGLMLPFAVIGVIFFGHLSYGLLSELPDTAPSVHGTHAVQDHFPDGEVGPLKVLIRMDGMTFEPRGGPRAEIAKLTNTLIERRRELGVARVRSWTEPLGKPAPRKEEPLSIRARAVKEKLAYELYVSKADPSTTRIDLIPEDDPFTRNSIARFNDFREKFREALPEALQDAEVSFIGATASVADLKEVTDRDQIRIDALVLAGVFAILVILLRRPMISLYLIVSVFFSYLATLGVTFAVYWAMDPAGFAGLDWKVPLFLFTILIAVGEDYNIFLITRIDEESEKHGPVHGVTVALEKTGSIISSCGIIMAGTFSSLLAGSLVGMDQLGFALAFGVLLDTFVVRPVLVPAYLILLHSGRLGRLGDWLGARPLVES